jgi:uncharacterized protein YciI
MRQLFAVMRTRTPAWDYSKPMRSQEQWTEHAQFMDEITASGFIVLGGPLEDGQEVLFAVSAPDEASINKTLARDPWSKLGLLVTKSIRPWTILLESPSR